ncbi:MAG: 50S ribosomal protein L5, partial [Flavobacteriales bacterium]|nr:50S ribosomal protein L5 [Flavobacteriales bacterium]
TQYAEEIVPNLKERFEYKSVMQVPGITKICLNQGLGKAIADKKVVEYATDEMSRIVGQKAVKTISTKDVSNFKLRKGMPIGARVTLRRDRMFDFLDRLIAVSLPRTRDFQGVSTKGFDGRGNFTFGIKEQVIFPEINLDEVKHFNGMDITIVTSANTDEEAKALLESFGFPFKKN